MNKIHKVVFCKATQTFKAVSEFAKGASKGSSSTTTSSTRRTQPQFQLAKLSIALAGILLGQQAMALTNANTDEHNVDTPTGHIGLVIGPGAQVIKGEDSVVIGKEAVSHNKSSVVIGVSAQGSVNTADAEGFDVVIGSLAKSVEGKSVVIGKSAEAHSSSTVVLGKDARVKEGYIKAVALGDASIVGEDEAATNETNETFTLNGIEFKEPGFAGAPAYPGFVVSVGGKKVFRQITNVAAGEISEGSTDAINGSQLAIVGTKLMEKIKANGQADEQRAKTPLIFTGNSNQDTDTFSGWALVDKEKVVGKKYTLDPNNAMVGRLTNTYGKVLTEKNGTWTNERGENITAESSRFKILLTMSKTPVEDVTETVKEPEEVTGYGAGLGTEAMHGNTIAIIGAGGTNLGEGNITGITNLARNTDKPVAGDYSSKNITTVVSNGEVQIQMAKKPEFDQVKVGTPDANGNITNPITIGPDAGGKNRVDGLDSTLPGTAGNDPLTATGPVTAPATLDDAAKKRAATVDDVLNAGWNLGVNTDPVDFVKAYDTVKFVDGNVTTVTAIDKSETSNSIKVDVKYDDATMEIKDGKLAAKLPVAGTIEADTGDNLGKVKPTAGDETKLANVGNVSEMINAAGWRLQEKGTDKDLVTPSNIVDFIDGDGTLVSVDNTTADDTKIKYSVATDNTTTEIKYKQPDGTFLTKETQPDGTVVYKDKDGNPVTPANPADLKSVVAAKTTPVVAEPDNKADGTPNPDAGKIAAPASPNSLATAGDVQTAINNAYHKVKNKNTDDVVTADATKTAKIKAGSTITFEAGKNLVSKLDDTGLLQVSTKNEVEFDNVAVGPVTINQTTGINAGDTKIKGVKAGSDGTDAVNFDQLKDFIAKGNIANKVAVASNSPFSYVGDVDDGNGGKKQVQLIRNVKTIQDPAYPNDPTKTKVVTVFEQIIGTDEKGKPITKVVENPENVHISTLDPDTGLPVKPTKITNVESTLPGSVNQTNLTPEQKKGQTMPDLTPDKENHAATISDVLSAGWNLQNNDKAKDFVKAYDTVNIKDGMGTVARVEVDDKGEVSNVFYDVATDNTTTQIIGDIDGKKVARGNDGKWYEVGPDGKIPLGADGNPDPAKEVTPTKDKPVTGTKVAAIAQDGPVVYTDKAGNKLYQQPDGSFKDKDGKPVEPADVIASMNNPAADGTMTKPQTLANVKSNLAGTDDVPFDPAKADELKKGQKAPTNLGDIKQNAATVDDVLNAGWNLQEKGADVDFVKAYDTVNFNDGAGTKVSVKTDDNLVSNIEYSVATDDVTTEITGTNKAGDKIVKVGDKYFTVDPKTGKPTKTEVAPDDVASTQVSAKTTPLVASDGTKKNPDGTDVPKGKVVTPESPNSLATAGDIANAINDSGTGILDSDGKPVETNGTDGMVNPGDAMQFNNGKGTIAKVTPSVDPKTGKETYAVSYGINPDNKTIKVNDDGSVSAIIPETQQTTGFANDDGSVAVNDTGDKVFLNANEIAKLINKSGHTVKGTNSAEQVTAKDGEMKVNPGDKLTIEAGKNLNASMKDGKLALSTAPVVDFDKVTVGPVTIDKNAGIDAGNTRITNVAPGKAPTDAVNVSQLEGVRDDLRAGVAGAAAMGMIAQPNESGEAIIGAGVGWHRGEAALAIGATATSDNNNWIIKGAVGVDTQKQATAGFSVNYKIW